MTTYFDRLTTELNAIRLSGHRKPDDPPDISRDVLDARISIDRLNEIDDKLFG